MMKKNYTLLFALLLTLSGYAQKTIFQIWDLPRKGCSLTTLPDMDTNSRTIMEIPDEEIWMEDHDFAMEDETFAAEQRMARQTAFNKTLDLLRTAAAADPNWLEVHHFWRDGMKFLRATDGRWSLHDEQGRTLIPTRYDLVITTKDIEGFVGYIQGRCNYYLPDGQAQLDREYLHLTPLPSGNFIVQQPDGFQLIDNNGNYLLKETFKHILPKDKGLLLLVPHEDKTSFAHFYHQGPQKSFLVDKNLTWSTSVLGNNRHVLFANQVLVDAQTQRTVLCSEEELVIELVDKKRGYLRVRKASENYQWYLIDATGNLLHPEPLAAIDEFTEHGYFIAGVTNPDSDAPTRIRFGLLNLEGEWAVDPIYNTIEGQLKAGRYLQITQSSTEYTFIDEYGKEVLPRRHYRSASVTPDGKYFKVVWQEGTDKYAGLLDLETEVFVPLDEIGFHNFRAATGCDNTYFAITADREHLLVNAQGQQISSIDKNYRFMSLNWPGQINAIYEIDTPRTRFSETLGCDGQRLTPDWVKPVDQYRAILQLDENYLLASDGQDQFFLLPDGSTVPSPITWSTYHIEAFTPGHYRLSANGHYGIVNDRGEVIVQPLLNILHTDHRRGWVSIGTEDKEVTLQSNTRPRVEVEYLFINDVNNLFMDVVNGQLRGIYTDDGREIIPIEYRHITIHRGIITAITTEGETHLYDLAGQKIEQ